VIIVTPWRLFSPGVRTHPVPIVQEARWAPEPIWTQRLEEKSLRLCWGSNIDRPVVQPVARHYTDWAARLIVSLKQTNILEVRTACIIRTMMMEAVRTSETSIYFDTTRRSIPEGCYLNTRRRDILKSHRLCTARTVGSTQHPVSGALVADCYESRKKCVCFQRRAVAAMTSPYSWIPWRATSRCLSVKHCRIDVWTVGPSVNSSGNAACRMSVSCSQSAGGVCSSFQSFDP
jgi:hypothetical protein